MKVAIQGERGSFSHEAAGRMAPRAHIVPCATSADVFGALKRRRVNAAVIPIENSLAGPVTEHYDLLLSHDVFIRAEYRLRIVHNLITAPGVRLGELRRAFSHPVALAQCRDFFAKHRRIRPEPFYDTAGSVKHIMAEGLRDAAAVAGPKAAPEYGAHVLMRGIEDDKQNFTRFLLIGRERRAARGANKASLAFAVKNIPGALFKALSVFALRDISLTKIESRPVRGRPWEYVFYVDILRGEDEAAANAINHLREISDFVKILGIYKAAA
jgi:prephenate dehydratase